MDIETQCINNKINKWIPFVKIWLVLEMDKSTAQQTYPHIRLGQRSQGVSGTSAMTLWAHCDILDGGKYPQEGLL